MLSLAIQIGHMTFIITGSINHSQETLQLAYVWWRIKSHGCFGMSKNFPFLIAVTHITTNKLSNDKHFIHTSWSQWFNLFMINVLLFWVVNQLCQVALTIGNIHTVSNNTRHSLKLWCIIELWMRAWDGFASKVQTTEWWLHEWVVNERVCMHRFLSFSYCNMTQGREEKGSTECRQLINNTPQLTIIKIKWLLVCVSMEVILSQFEGAKMFQPQETINHTVPSCMHNFDSVKVNSCNSHHINTSKCVKQGFYSQSL